jgi:hypothetical protein
MRIPEASSFFDRSIDSKYTINVNNMTFRIFERNIYL